MRTLETSKIKILVLYDSFVLNSNERSIDKETRSLIRFSVKYQNPITYTIIFINSGMKF